MELVSELTKEGEQEMPDRHRIYPWVDDEQVCVKNIKNLTLMPRTFLFLSHLDPEIYLHEA